MKQHKNVHERSKCIISLKLNQQGLVLSELTYHLHQSPSSEVNSCLVYQEIPKLL
jgi:hypothetical protein